MMAGFRKHSIMIRIERAEIAKRAQGFSARFRVFQIATKVMGVKVDRAEHVNFGRLERMVSCTFEDMMAEGEDRKNWARSIEGCLETLVNSVNPKSLTRSKNQGESRGTD